MLNQAKGPQTDGDAERARSQIPNIGTSAGARKIIFDYIVKKNNQKIDSFKAMSAYKKQHNGSLVGFEPTIDAPVDGVSSDPVIYVRDANGNLVIKGGK